MGGKGIHLASESIQEFDGVDGQNGMNRARCSLEIGEHILAKEVDNVDKVIRGCNSELTIS